MNKHIFIAILASLLFLTPSFSQRLPRKGCPQRARVNELREKTRQKEIASRVKTKSSEATKRYGLIILAAFKNESFSVDKSYFETLINGSSPESALSYFNEQWDGHYDFHFDISDIVQLPNDYSYYGKEGTDGDQAPEQMVMDACKLVDSSIDFSKYDNDGDGEVDNVFIFYAGDQGNGEDDRVWPHQWYVKDGAGETLQLDNVLINNYACTSELENGMKAGIGTFCHEYTHTFGIPDLYDSDDTKNGYAEAEWACIDLMDAGNLNDDSNTPPYYSALERWFFEMQPALELTEGEHTLRPVHEKGDYYLLPTDQTDEVYLIECRSNEKWDKYIGGSGMLIYHVDMTSASVRKYWNKNELNAYAEHQCMDLIECNPAAAAAWRRSAANDFWGVIDRYVPTVFWPDGGNTAFASSTDPSWKFWSGASCPVAISDIRKNRDGSVSFKVVGSAGAILSPVSIVSSLVLQDACIIRWKTDNGSYEGDCVLKYKESDSSEWKEVKVSSFTKSNYAFVLDGLKPRTAYDVNIYTEIEGIPGQVNKLASFTTKSAARSGEPPYIYLKNAERTPAGSFKAGAEIALRLYNSPGGEVEWFFDGEKIQPSASGYYTLTSSGTLRAVLHADGEVLTFTKIIKVL